MGAIPETWAIPSPTPFTEAWFTSGTLAVQRCVGCGTLQHPPEEVCYACGAMSFDAAVLAPRGTVFSHTVVHYAASPALADSVPYAVVLVALDDAPEIRVVGNLDGPVEDVRIGLPVEAHWVTRDIDGDTIRLPQWRPAG